jgi:hypothetical protein
MTRRTYGSSILHVLTGNFALLLVALLLFLLLYPLFLSSEPGMLVLNIFMSLLMITALRAIGRERKIFKAAILSFIASILASIVLFIWPSHFLAILSIALQMLFFIIVSLGLQHHLYRSEKITTEHLACALCIYLFIGIIGALAYFLVELWGPGSFAIASMDGSKVHSWQAGSHLHHALLYYSFMTMATVGYGDIAPVTPFARSLAMLEVIIAQFYLAVLIGRLVGSYIITPLKEEHPRPAAEGPDGDAERPADHPSLETPAE